MNGRWMLSWLPGVLLPVAVAAQVTSPAPATLPAPAVERLGHSLAAAKPHAKHVWRDTPPINADGTINGYIEIAKGDRNKWEFRIDQNARAIDRVMPESLGGYPINYGFVPQTVSYDGDPFDILVLGPAIEGGTVVRGVPVGVMVMEDDRILDSKVIVSPIDQQGRPRYQLTEAIKKQLADFFNRYKRQIPGAVTSVPGFGTREDGVALVRQTHAFFEQCRDRSGVCLVKQGD